MKKVAAMLKRRFENIITYLTHPITNATSEPINAKIQWVKYTARGFRNKTELHQRDLFPLEVWTWLLGPTENPVGRKNISSATLIERTRLK